MSTPTSRLAELVRRKRGVMQMPTMDLTQPPGAGDALTDEQINAVGETPMVMPELDLTGAALAPSGAQSWPTNDPSQDPDTVTTSAPVVRPGARTDAPSAMATQVTPLEPTITSRNGVPEDRHARLMAALQRTQQAPPEEAQEPVTPAQNSIPALAAKTVMGAAIPAPPTVATQPAPQRPEVDTGRADAQEADRKSRLTAGMELAARQLVGGITRTDVPQGIGAAPSKVPAAQEAAKARRQALADALNRQRQGTLDASTIDRNAAAAEKDRRLPADKVAQPTSNRTEEDRLRAEKLKLEREKFEAKQRPKGGMAASGADATSNAEAIASYKGAPPSPRQKDYEAIMGRVRKINPAYDPQKWVARGHAMSNQSTNEAINSAKAVTHHIELLKKAIAEEDPGMFDSPGVNGLSRKVSNAMGSGKYTAKEAAARVVGSELAQSLKESDMAGREHIQQLVNPDQSKEQWAKSLPELERLRDEKLKVYSDTLRDLGTDTPAAETPDNPKAATKLVGGVTYEKRADGKWYPAGE